jgi:hypothetical protein
LADRDPNYGSLANKEKFMKNKRAYVSKRIDVERNVMAARDFDDAENFFPLMVKDNLDFARSRKRILEDVAEQRDYIKMKTAVVPYGNFAFSKFRRLS